MTFEIIGIEQAEYIAAHQEAYPEAMRENDADEWAKLLSSTNYSIGAWEETSLVGWRIFTIDDIDNTALYAYDLTVLPAYQGQRLGGRIVRASLKAARWDARRVHSHLRSTSYHIVADPLLLFESGYYIQSDVIRPDHYYDVYGIHEDAHELWVAPITSTRI